MDRYDVVVIGAGPAGYVAAIRAAHLGMKTVCIDDWEEGGKPSPGGTCLNVGCIPSKALLESSALYENALHNFHKHGIGASELTLDIEAMMKRKAGVVSDLTSGVQALLHTNGVSLITGRGRLMPNKHVAINSGEGEEQTVVGDHIILAPGSTPKALPSVPYDGKHIVDSTGALSFDKVPKKLAIIGAGVIGLELGTVWRRLGSKVTLLKKGPGLLPDVDQQIAKIAQQHYKKQGLEFIYGRQIVGHTVNRNKVKLQLQGDEGEEELTVDKVVVAIGRVANTANLIDESCGVRWDDGGLIVVDDHCRTDVEGIYAIGDAVRGPMLAHKGSEEGVMVAELIAGHYASVNYETIPSVIYSSPEVAWCGKGEEELKRLGVDYRVGTFPFAANGRARAGGETAGMVKVLADAKSDRVLGVHMIGPHVSELVAQAVIAMEMQASSEDLALTMFAHPTLSESLHEAALDVSGAAIHKARGRR